MGVRVRAACMSVTHKHTRMAANSRAWLDGGAIVPNGTMARRCSLISRSDASHCKIYRSGPSCACSPLTGSCFQGSSGFRSGSPVLTQPGRARKLGALSSIAWSNHGVVSWEAPLFPVLLRSEAVLCHQVAPQGSEFFTILQADDEIDCYGLLDRNGGALFFNSRFSLMSRRCAAQRGIGLLDKIRQIAGMNRIAA